VLVAGCPVEILFPVDCVFRFALPLKALKHVPRVGGPTGLGRSWAGRPADGNECGRGRFDVVKCSVSVLLVEGSFLVDCVYSFREACTLGSGVPPVLVGAGPYALPRVTWMVDSMSVFLVKRLHFGGSSGGSVAGGSVTSQIGSWPCTSLWRGWQAYQSEKDTTW
jgi:hypothetical protein